MPIMQHQSVRSLSPPMPLRAGARAGCTGVSHVHAILCVYLTVNVWKLECGGWWCCCTPANMSSSNENLYHHQYVMQVSNIHYVNAGMFTLFWYTLFIKKCHSCITWVDRRWLIWATGQCITVCWCYFVLKMCNYIDASSTISSASELPVLILYWLFHLRH